MSDSANAPPRSFTERLGLSQGPRPGGGPFIHVPGLISGLIFVMVAMFAVQVLLPGVPQRRFEIALAFIPLRFNSEFAAQEGLLGLLVPFIGHIFLHGSVQHLVFNALWMAIFGAGVANRMCLESSSGRSRIINTTVFLAFFLASGIAGATFFFVMQPQSPVLLIGASGAISGLMGAAMRFAFRPFTGFPVAIGGLSPITARPVLAASAIYIGVNLMTALSAAGFGEPLNIAWEAHIGGYLFGLLAFPVFDAMVRRPSIRF